MPSHPAPRSTAILTGRLLTPELFDPAFRQHLLANPKRTLEQALGITLPASLEVVVLEETPSRIWLVVPRLAPASEELSDEALAAVAGGVLTATLPEPMPMPADVEPPLPPVLVGAILARRRGRLTCPPIQM